MGGLFLVQLGRSGVLTVVAVRLLNQLIAGLAYIFTAN
jgi:hypothetical protein